MAPHKIGIGIDSGIDIIKKGYVKSKGKQTLETSTNMSKDYCSETIHLRKVRFFVSI